ncbi:MAG: MoaD/ThiS family protein [Sedimenticolaceae bacterium]|jgi:sulfur carrier protein ThiS
MQIHFELYASLMRHLPSGSSRHRATLDVDETTSAHDLIDTYGVPREMAHLVVVNGIFTPPEKRDEPLKEGDVLAIWPPVAGG